LNARGSNAASGLSLPDARTSITALVVVIMKARCIARALASKKHIACGVIRRLQPSQKPGKYYPSNRHTPRTAY
jgi:hypothetical protein